MGVEFKIRRLAGLLKLLLVEVDSHKLYPRAVSRESTGSRLASGSRPPGNITAISLHDEILRELAHWARTFDIDPAISDDLCDRIALRAFYIAEHPDAEFFLSDLRVWIRRCETLTGRGLSITDLASQPERRQTAKSICWRLAKAGHTNVTREHLLTWAARGHISAAPTPKGCTFLYTEVFTWVTRDAD